MVITCNFFLWEPLLSCVLWARILHNAGFKKKLQITSEQKPGDQCSIVMSRPGEKFITEDE